MALKVKSALIRSFFKLMLVGYLENINSDRRIIAFASMRLDILFFIGYDIDEPLPWHSTLSRTRQLYGESVFLKLFQKVLAMCISKGMVRGKRQAIDSAFVKANASLDSLIEKEILDDAADFADELNDEDLKTLQQDPFFSFSFISINCVLAANEMRICAGGECFE